MTVATAPSPELAAALARHGIRPARFVLLSPLGLAKGRRHAYLVEGEEGERIKLRQFESDETAREVYELRQGLEKAFAPAIARYDCVLAEEWVDGEPLTSPEAEQRVEEAGALLGRLHRGPLPAGTPDRLSTSRWRRGAESDIEVLARAAVLGPGEAAHLREALNQRDPVTARPALVHLDFCADNMIIDRHDRLRLVDNEQISVGPAGFDLGRTFHLWPMPRSAWSGFWRGYRLPGPPASDAVGFWRLAAVLVGARVFLTCSPERLETSLVLLRRLIDGEGLEDPGP